ncbi:hypothetical protein HK104_010647, partial [Borealophlyctis nickersoniae]
SVNLFWRQDFRSSRHIYGHQPHPRIFGPKIRRCANSLLIGTEEPSGDDRGKRREWRGGEKKSLKAEDEVDEEVIVIDDSD